MVLAAVHYDSHTFVFAFAHFAYIRFTNTVSPTHFLKSLFRLHHSPPLSIFLSLSLSLSLSVRVCVCVCVCACGVWCVCVCVSARAFACMRAYVCLSARVCLRVCFRTQWPLE